MKLKLPGGIAFLPNEPEARDNRLVELVRGYMGTDAADEIAGALGLARQAERLEAETERLLGRIEDLEAQKEQLEDRLLDLRGL